MTKFLNFALDNKFEKRHLFKHILFGFFWLIGILLFVFRIDLLVIRSNSLNWLKISLPTIYFLSLLIMVVKQKWYYTLAYVAYPVLLILWFIPKTILRTGKIYLFGSYLSMIFKRVMNYKLTLFNLVLFVITTILFTTINRSWTRWLAILIFTYFYSSYIYRLVKRTFKPAALFDISVEESIRKTVKQGSSNSVLFNTYVIQKTDEKLAEEERKEKQIRRSLLANYALDLVSRRLNRFKGKKSFVISWIFSLIAFIFISICYFSFLNFQLYKIDSGNFQYNGSYPVFDFIYYTLKTTTFGDIELVKPISIVARISEICSFTVIGIFIFIIFISVLFSLRQEKINEDLKLTSDLVNIESSVFVQRFQSEFGMDINAAHKEVKNIDESIKKLREIIDKLI